MTEFSSAFSDRVSSFPDYRTIRGFEREAHLRHLIKFDRWCMQAHPEQTLLSRKLALGWIYNASASDYNVTQWVTPIRWFTRYLRAIGEEAYILSEKYAPIKNKAAAYIFTDIEFTAFFRAIG